MSLVLPSLAPALPLLSTPPRKWLCWREFRLIGALAAALLTAACGGTDGPVPSSSAALEGAGNVSRLQAQIASPSQGRWAAPVDLGFVPAAAAHVPNGAGEGAGRVLMWGAEHRMGFGIQDETSPSIRTWVASFDAATGAVAGPTQQATGHNMFCPGTTNLPDGRLLVNGGSTSRVTSIYDPSTDTWARPAGTVMNIPRAYQGNTLLRDGSVLTLGGSWNGGFGGKDAEIWSDGPGWRRLANVTVGSFLTSDRSGIYRSDNHMWLQPTGNGRVLHAGPSVRMNWVDSRGDGNVVSAGRRGDDADAMNGSIVMYEPGRMLVTGGAPHYTEATATNSAFLIDATTDIAVTRLPAMQFARVFHNNVVLPDGTVMVIGGKDRADVFNDDNARLVPELWDPATRTFTALPAMSVPRTYHGFAMLLPDGRVLSAGSGLCGCAADQTRMQIYTPHYLLNPDGSPAVRPRITAAPTQAEFGSTIRLETDRAVNRFALVRLSSNTHSVNNDQRRIPLTILSNVGNTYTVAAPSNPGWALPGQYMLFALNADGVPSLARTVRLGLGGVPLVNVISDQAGSVGNAVSAVTASAANSAGATFSATGLPPGLTINPTTGLMSGTPTTAGNYRVTVTLATTSGATSTELNWRVTGVGTVTPPGSVRWVRFEVLSEVTGAQRASMAELNLLTTSGELLPRDAWTVGASNSEEVNESSPASAAVDGDPNTFWHTRWSDTTLPVTFTVDLGSATSVGGFRYLPRPAGPYQNNGVWATYRVYFSADGFDWGAPVFSGDLRTPAAAADRSKTVMFGPVTPPVNRPPVWSPAPVAQSTQAGVAVNLALAVTDADGDPLAYSATGLPTGLRLAPTTGVISGTPTTPGSFTISASASDNRGGTITANFAWTVSPAAAPLIQPVVSAPGVAGRPLTLTAIATGGSGFTYAWDFGDGTARTAFGTANTVTKTYATGGLYTVTLFVRAIGGAISEHRFVQAIAGAAPTVARASVSSSVAFEARTPGPSRVWVVNPDNNSVSAFDATTNARLAEVPVGAAPQSVAVSPNGWVWVTNRDAATISILQGGLTVAQTIALPRASQPYGIAFAPDGSAYVALAALGAIQRINPDRTLGLLRSVGADVRELAVTADGARVLASRFITPPMPGESGTVIDVSPTRGAQVVVLNAATMAVQNTVILRHSSKPDTTVQGRGIPNYLGAPAISPDGQSAWVPSKQDNILRGALRDSLALDFQNSVRAVSSRVSLANPAAPVEDYPSRIDHDNASLASAAVHHPSGSYLFVALETSRQVAVVDPAGRRELVRVEVGRAPQGMAVSADGLRLYVSNFMDRTLTVLDLSRLVNFGEYSLPIVATPRTITTDRLGAAVLNGKQLFYDARDPRLARDSYMSCATCHRDGSSDGRVWDLTSLGEGLRNTISLRGRAGMGHGALHWSGNFDEVQDFEGQIRALAGGSGLMTDTQFNTGTRRQPLGDRKAGVSSDLDALAAYVGSLASVDPTPRRNADGSPTAAAVAGRALFQSMSCATCHGGLNYTSSALTATLRNVGTLKAASGQRLGAPLTGLDAPTLRDVWATAPYLHDGSAPSVEAAIRAHTGSGVANAAAIATLTPTELGNLAEYVRQIGNDPEIAPGTPTPPTPATTRFVRFEQINEVTGSARGSMAELNLLTSSGTVLARTGWTVVASSAEVLRENAAATAAIDGDPATFWHTDWTATTMPVTFTVNLGAPQAVGGFRYLPRPVGPFQNNGVWGNFRVFFSNDGVTWGTPVHSGDLRTVPEAGDRTKTVLFGPPPPNRAPTLTLPTAQATLTGTTVRLPLAANDLDGDPLTYSATGLPAGLAIGSTTGIITGVTTTAIVTTANITVVDGRGGTATGSFGWTVTQPPPPPAGSTQWVRFEQLTEVLGGARGSMAELNLLGPTGAALPRAGWTVAASSAEVVRENAAATAAIDGDPNTFWHTMWSGTTMPVTFTVNLGSPQRVSGFRYLPRPDGPFASNGLWATYRVSFSTDGVNWGTPVHSGDLRTVAPALDRSRTVMFGAATPPPPNQAPTLTAVSAQTTTAGTPVTLALAASDPDNDILGYAATGLPPGLTMGALNGVISGLPLTAGTSSVSVAVADGRGGTATTTFNWTINPAPPPPSGAVRFVRFEQLTEVNGGARGSMAELNLLSTTGTVLPRTAWLVSASSAEVDLEFAPAAAAIDGDPSTFWHTRWSGTVMPVNFIVDMGTAQAVGGFRYLPRPVGPYSANGVWATYRVYFSNDGVTWGTPVHVGDLRTVAAAADRSRTVVFTLPPVAP